MEVRDRPAFEVGDAVCTFARAVREAGGELLVVGGWVRDGLLGRESSDLDLEAYGLDERSLLALFEGRRPARRVGRAFPVWRIGSDAFGDRVDASRRPLATWELSLGDAGLANAGGELADRHAQAARRRDLRVNSMAWHPLDERLFDPHGGCADLLAGRLDATDGRRFGEDPLRVLRVARLAASLGAMPSPELVAVCRAIDLSAASVPAERVLAELNRILATASPGIALRVLRKLGGLSALPELEALVDVPQDERWHPEGCVWTHTCMVVDEAARLRDERASSSTDSSDGEAEGGVSAGAAREAAGGDDWLLLGALCHDLGKAHTTVVEDGSVRSPGHDLASAEVAARMLRRLRASARTVTAVETLARWHLAPTLLIEQGAGDAAYRRLVRRLDSGGVDAALLLELARADHLGRTTEEALARRFEAGARFAERIRSLGLERVAPPDAVRGRDVVAAGIEPGPRVGRVLERCREVQDRTGWTDGARILAGVLAEPTGEGGRSES